MPWVTRKSGRAYYYRKVREGTKVRSIYVPITQADAAAQDDLERAQQRVAAREAQQEAATTRTQVQAAQRAVRTEVDQGLAAAGYHRHRGELRKRRYARTDSETE